MRPRPFNLAIETSDFQGWISLGREHELLESAMVGSAAIKPPETPEIPETRNTPGLSPRRGGELMPAIDVLLQKHNVQPADLGEVYVSIGPGSFTGLRVAVTTVRMLARFLDVKVVAIPTIQAIAQQIPTDGQYPDHLAIALNHKRQSAYVVIHRRQPHQWQPLSPPTVMTMEELFAQHPGGLGLLAPALPADFPLPPGSPGVTRLPDDLGKPHSDSVWLLGRRAAQLGQYTDPAALLPIYARPPEAVELWNQRHGQA